MQCLKCGKVYVHAHTCSVGVCKLCQQTYKNLPKHKCIVSKSLNYDSKQILDNLSTYTCCGCRVRYIDKKRMRCFKGINLCVNCYNIPEIHYDIKYIRHQLNLYYIAHNKTKCSICYKDLIDLNTVETLTKFEADHIDINKKTMNIGQMITQGYPLLSIIEELQYCRLLCILCHDIVTFSQQKTGLYTLKRITNIPDHVIQSVYTNCKELEQLLRISLE
jgi:hypothetical protein